LFSSHPKRERDHLNTLAPTTGETTITPQDKTKSNTPKQACILKNTYNTKSTHTKLKPGLVASYDIRPGTKWNYSGRMGRDGKARKQMNRVKKGKGKSKRY